MYNPAHMHGTGKDAGKGPTITAAIKAASSQSPIAIMEEFGLWFCIMEMPTIR